MANEIVYEARGGRVAMLGGVVAGVAITIFALLLDAGWFTFALLVAGGVYTLWLHLISFAYRGVLDADGGLRFTSLLRERQCRVEDISRIAIHRSEGGSPIWFKLRTTVGTIHLRYSSGEAMVDAIRRANPAIESGSRWWPRWARRSALSDEDEG